MKNNLNKIFNKTNGIIIGALHFAPLLGYSDYPGDEIILKNALRDLSAFEEGGVDGVIIENNYDIPHKIFVKKETADEMLALGKEIKKIAKKPLGVSVLWNDYKKALLIAQKIGAKFIRIPVFVDSVKTNYGDIIADPQAVIKFRKEINAEDISLFTDIHVKHAELLKNKSIEDSAKEAIKSGSDALIVTGRWTGDAPDLAELKKIREVVGDFPILIGSGADDKNINELFEYANGAIISTSLKEGGIKETEVNVKGWEQRIDRKLVKQFVKKVYK
ncbi:MAG TPA: BtpA/SgcQ family protein [Candidatus Bipolaricaulota bacterium]|nr:BtpA/SgcQ family protein [Candidatus Bipolaricaulota bacterium]